MSNEYEDASPDQLCKLFRSRPRPSTSGKLKQTELAARVQVDVRAVQQWESGERLPSAENLRKLLRAFLEEGLFLPQREREEAHLLWQSVQRTYEQRPGYLRQFPPFDEAWFAALLAQHPSFPLPDHKPVTQRERAQQRLPLSLTGFVGREQEMSEIRRQLATTRLLTLAGPGGCGKTRLALEVARHLEYPDGVYFVDLSTIREPALLLEAVAMTLDVYEGRGQDLKQAVEAVLRRKQMLLLLDNCEHLIEACAVAVEAWLQTCPTLHVLATSRELLHIAGEHVLFLAPLPVPDTADRALPLAELATYASVRLFLERTQAVLPSFQLISQIAESVIEICRRLDGLPLALELAAAQMKLLSVEQLAARLSTPLSLQMRGSRTAPLHRQTLRASLDWSYHLLSEQEKHLLQQMSVFAGGWTLDALETVYQPAALSSGEQSDLLALLSELVAKSLVAVQRTNPDGEPRYRLLETIRQYAQERLEEERDITLQKSLQERYVWFYVRFVEEVEPHLRSDQRTRWLLRLQVEYENIRMALSWCQCHDEGWQPGLRLVAALYWFWLHQGFWSEGCRWLSALLRLARTNHTDHQAIGPYAKAVHGAALFAWAQGQQQEAARLALESVAEARRSGDHDVLAASLRLFGLVLQKQGRDVQALTFAEESVVLARAQGNLWSLAASLNMLGTILRMQGNVDQARDAYEESIILLRAVGDRWELSGPLRNLGNLLMREGDYQRAHALYRESLLCCKEMKGKWFLSRSLEDIALLLSKQGEVLRAATILGSAEALRDALGATVMPFSIGTYEQSLSIVHAQLRAEDAQQAWQTGRAMTIEQVIDYTLEQ